MEKSIDKIELLTTSEGYVTRSAVQVGDTLIVEQPLFVTPHWDCEQMKCSNCMLDSFVMCKKCQVFPLCIDCNSHNSRDCDFFSAGGAAAAVNKNVLVKNYAIYALLKFLLLLEHETDVERRTACATLLSRAQEQLSSQAKVSALQQEQRKQVLQPLLQSGLMAHFHNLPQFSNNDADGQAMDLLQRVCHEIDTHAFELLNREGDSLKGIYVQAAHLPHSCVPNVCIAIDEQNYEMLVYAAVAIPHGEPLNNCYVNQLMGTAQRQQQLRLSRGAHKQCTCARCSDPSELGTHLSTLRCTQCNDGLLMPSQPLEDSANSATALPDWRCIHCDNTLAASNVQQLLDTVSDEFACVAGDLPATEALLSKHAAHLHPQHFLLAEMKQHLASLLSALPLLGIGSAEAGRHLLQRRVQLCAELLPLVRAVQPASISKLYAIALFEYLLAMRQLTELERRQQHIDDIDYGHKLLQAKHLAMEAMDLLRFEPPNTPEGHIAQRVAHEAKQITERLQHLNITEL